MTEANTHNSSSNEPGADATLKARGMSSGAARGQGDHSSEGESPPSAVRSAGYDESDLEDAPAAEERQRDEIGRLIVEDPNVLWNGSDFRVYRTARGINPEFADNTAISRRQRERYLTLGEELAQLNHLIHLLSHSWLQALGFKSMQGRDLNRPYYEDEMVRGIVQAVAGDVTQGKATLEALAGRLEKRLCNKGRVTYFGVCLIVTVLVAFAAWTVWFSSTGAIQEIALVAAAGAIGALLSSAAGLRALKIDPGATLFMNWIYGGQRMLVGVLGAVVLYLALRAGLATELIPGLPEAGAGAALPKPAPLDPHKLAFVSILAGFSERLVPNLLDRRGDRAAGDRGAAEHPAG